MIIIKIKGGLGNQMFQYAFGRRLALDRKTGLKLDATSYGDQPVSETIRAFGLSNFNITAECATAEEVDENRNPYGIFSKVLRQIDQRMNSHYTGYLPFVLKKRSSYLEGYWKNEKYFLPIADIIRQEFTLKNPPGAAAKEIRKQIVSAALPVAVHFRRGDYAMSKHQAYYGLLSDEYYKEAVKKMGKLAGKSMTLFVFSDDIAWVKKHVSFDFPVVYVSQKGIADYEEMMLMSFCHHNIIANSTFSWWAAWLNINPDKIVIAPKRWLAKTGTDHYHELPDSWIKI